MGPILTAFQEHGEIEQCNVLCFAADQLKPVICHKRWGLLSKGVLLLSDNADLYTATVMVETVQQLGLELLPLPAYSPDLPLSDYHNFGILKRCYAVAAPAPMIRSSKRCRYGFANN